MNDYIGSFLQGFAGPLTSPAAQQALMQRSAVSRMTPEDRAMAMANPSDVTKIKGALSMVATLTDKQRKKVLKELEASLSSSSLPYFNLMVSKLGEPAALTMETWGAPPPGQAAVMQAWGGTRPGFPEELAVRQLPTGEREAELKSRLADVELQYPGATEVALGLLRGVGAEGVLTPEQAATKRAQEGGAWGEVTTLTRGWPGKTAGEKQKDFDIARKTGTLSDLAATAVKAMPIYAEAPEWVNAISEGVLPSLGMKKVKGKVEDDWSDDIGAKLGQQTLRRLFRVDPSTLPPLSSYNASTQNELRAIAYGARALIPEDRARVEGGKLTGLGLTEDLITLIEHPLIDYTGTSEFPDAVLSVLAHFGGNEELTSQVMRLVLDPSILTGLGRISALE